MERGAEGALIVDKPSGPTSHDVVARVRRLFATRRVGHAGTLDPMATGVLVVLIGEATKLAPYVTAQSKRYEARVVLGRATATLDALGATTEEREVPGELARELETLATRASLGGIADVPRLAAALEGERIRTFQVPPAFSAIQVGGRRSYDRARRGEEVVLDPRPVRVATLRLVAARPGELDLELEVDKGYYVRSFARDLGAALGVPAHLGALRRTASGPFAIGDAVAFERDPEGARSRLQPLAAVAAAALPTAGLTAEGATRARAGRKLVGADFASGPPPPGPAAWMDEDGRLVAIGSQSGDGWAVERGFVQ